jgi:hypothetical protein
MDTKTFHGKFRVSKTDFRTQLLSINQSKASLNVEFWMSLPRSLTFFENDGVPEELLDLRDILADSPIPRELISIVSEYLREWIDLQLINIILKRSLFYFEVGKYRELSARQTLYVELARAIIADEGKSFPINDQRRELIDIFGERKLYHGCYELFAIMIGEFQVISNDARNLVIDCGEHTICQSLSDQTHFAIYHVMIQIIDLASKMSFREMAFDKICFSAYIDNTLYLVLERYEDSLF